MAKHDPRDNCDCKRCRRRRAETADWQVSSYRDGPHRVTVHSREVKQGPGSVKAAVASLARQVSENRFQTVMLDMADAKALAEHLARLMYLAAPRARAEVKPDIEESHGETQKAEAYERRGAPTPSGLEWCVDSYGSDGECYVTAFRGPDDESRAKAYAAWLNGDGHYEEGSGATSLPGESRQEELNRIHNAAYDRGVQDGREDERKRLQGPLEPLWQRARAPGADKVPDDASVTVFMRDCREAAEAVGMTVPGGNAEPKAEAHTVADAAALGAAKVVAIHRWGLIEEEARRVLAAADNLSIGDRSAEAFGRLYEKANHLRNALNRPEPDKAWMR